MSKTVTLTPCPNCGGMIPAEAPQGLCPKCVLRGAAKPSEADVPATATAEVPSLERLAAAFPQLEVLELIGRGGMGFVFKARQPHLDRFVALKLLPDKLAANPQFTERFNREGRVLARLNHPNIVSVFDFGQTGGFYYLLMEYVDGVNLRQAMQAGRFSPAEALTLVPKVCGALQYAHEQGILHRDIKPENLLLDSKGQVKIADFGIAKLLGDDSANVTLTHTGAALGSFHYMAPEQIEKPATVDHRADLYSLGVVLYEMLPGELPIGRFAAPSAKTPMNADVDDVVFRTLAKDRELRFQTANEFKAGVEQLGAGGVEGGPEDDTAAPVQPVPSWVTRLGWLFCGLGFVGMIPTLVGWFTGFPMYHPALLLGFTGMALLTRTRRWWFLALGTCVAGFVFTLVFGLGGGLQYGLIVFPSFPGPYAVSLVGWLLFVSVFGGGIWVLCKPELKTALRLRRSGASLSGSWWMVAGVAVVSLGLLMVLRNVDRGPMPRRTAVVATPAPPRPNSPSWPPLIPPGGKPDLDGIRQEAADLTGRGRYEEALERVLWYHQHALEYEPAQVGVRLSFALAQWEELARHYQPAKMALIETRDRAALEFQNGGGYFGLFQEVAALNNALRAPEATYSLFKGIYARDPGLARQCYAVVESQLVERKEYALCLQFIPNAQRRFDQALQSWERGKDLANRNPELNRSRIGKQLEGEFVATSRRLIEILVGTGNRDQAIQIQEQALKVLNIAELRSAVTDAELKIRIH